MEQANMLVQNKLEYPEFIKNLNILGQLEGFLRHSALKSFEAHHGRLDVED